MLLNSNHHDLLLHDMHMSNCEFKLEPFCLESDLLNTESYIYHYNDAILITYIVPTKISTQCFGTKFIFDFKILTRMAG